jgi:hypothetical protein
MEQELIEGQGGCRGCEVSMALVYCEKDRWWEPTGPRGDQVGLSALAL